MSGHAIFHTGIVRSECTRVARAYLPRRFPAVGVLGCLHAWPWRPPAGAGRRMRSGDACPRLGASGPVSFTPFVQLREPGCRSPAERYLPARFRRRCRCARMRSRGQGWWIRAPAWTARAGGPLSLAGTMCRAGTPRPSGSRRPYGHARGASGRRVLALPQSPGCPAAGTAPAVLFLLQFLLLVELESMLRSRVVRGAVPFRVWTVRNAVAASWHAGCAASPSVLHAAVGLVMPRPIPAAAPACFGSGASFMAGMCGRRALRASEAWPCCPPF